MELLEKKRIVKGRLKEVPKLKHQHELCFLESLINKDSRILEFGSGGSTIWFAKRVLEVVACEDLTEWKYALVKQLDELELKNVTIFLHDHYHKVFNWDKKDFDLMYVDCYNRRESPIYPCVKNYYSYIRPGGYIVFGDKNTFVSLQCKMFMRKKGWRKIEIQKPYQKCYWQRPTGN